MSWPRLPDFAIEVTMSRWEFSARHNLTASDAESMSIDELLALAGSDSRQALLDLELAYIPSWGTDALRAAIASSYDELALGDVLTFAGAEEALFWILQLLLEPDDHAIVTVPNYQSFEAVALAGGCAVDALPLWSGEGRELQWTLDLDRFRSLLRPNTKLAAVNFPNNPTGFVPDLDTWREFLEICTERGIRVVSDEVHRGLELEPPRTLAQAADLSPEALSINVMSKAYGLPGLRVGWVACRDRSVLQRLERAKHYTSICNTAPGEFLARLALDHGGAILARNHAIVEANNRLFEKFADDHQGLFDYHPPDGSCVAFPRYLGADGVEAFCRKAVEQDGVLLLPASVFRSALVEIPMDRFRIGLGRNTFAEGLEVLGAHLARPGARPSL